jgi:hypothetical protein
MSGRRKKLRAMVDAAGEASRTELLELCNTMMNEFEALEDEAFAAISDLAGELRRARETIREMIAAPQTSEVQQILPPQHLERGAGTDEQHRHTRQKIVDENNCSDSAEQLHQDLTAKRRSQFLTGRLGSSDASLYTF